VGFSLDWNHRNDHQTTKSPQRRGRNLKDMYSWLMGFIKIAGRTIHKVISNERLLYMKTGGLLVNRI
jgi:hypothetical protein